MIPLICLVCLVVAGIFWWRQQERLLYGRPTSSCFKGLVLVQPFQFHEKELSFSTFRKRLNRVVTGEERERLQNLPQVINGWPTRDEAQIRAIPRSWREKPIIIPGTMRESEISGGKKWVCQCLVWMKQGWEERTFYFEDTLDRHWFSVAACT